MASWNLALRFVLEIGALVGLGVTAWQSAAGLASWAAAIAVPLIAITLWGTFNVPNDPSRSGEAPVEVPGWLRLVLEFAILGAGAAAIGITWSRMAGVGFAVLIVFHYAAAWNRIRWLIST